MRGPSLPSFSEVADVRSRRVSFFGSCYTLSQEQPPHSSEIAHQGRAIHAARFEVATFAEVAPSCL
jgi:hypothetical protein